VNLNSGIAIEIGAPMVDFTAIGSARMAGGYNAINCESIFTATPSLLSKEEVPMCWIITKRRGFWCSFLRSRVFGDDRGAHRRVRRYRYTAFQKV
jgi:hypothetical protein